MVVSEPETHRIHIDPKKGKSPCRRRPDDPDRDDIVALRAGILALVTEINIGLADPD